MKSIPFFVRDTLTVQTRGKIICNKQKMSRYILQYGVQFGSLLIPSATQEHPKRLLPITQINSQFKTSRMRSIFSMAKHLLFRTIEFVDLLDFWCCGNISICQIWTVIGIQFRGNKTSPCVAPTSCNDTFLYHAVLDISFDAIIDTALIKIIRAWPLWRYYTRYYTLIAESSFMLDLTYLCFELIFLKRNVYLRQKQFIIPCPNYLLYLMYLSQFLLPIVSCLTFCFNPYGSANKFERNTFMLAPYLDVRRTLRLNVLKLSSNMFFLLPD